MTTRTALYRHYDAEGKPFTGNATSFKPQGAKGFRKARVCDCGDHGFVGLNRGLVSFIDADDVPKASTVTWTSVRPGKSNVYAINQSGKLIEGKRSVYLHQYVCPGEGGLVDHADHDTLNNRKANLRRCTQVKNQQNSNVRGVVPFKGVSKKRSKYVAGIKVNGKRVRLGNYDSPIDAAQAYDRAAERYFGEFALTNQTLGLFDAREARQ